MASTTTRWTYLGLALGLAIIAAGLGGCANPAVLECGNTGVLCPAGTHCAAAQGICIPDAVTCGDAKRDDGEICDDGNTLDGDGCSFDCRSNETCGNTKTDLSVGEVCDDGNTVNGDKCSADCKSLETCGNNIEDVGEACDDGNNIDADGCSANCMSNERCGNGTTDEAVGEVCDPPRASTCGPDCKSLLQCGNAIIDRGEECDDGQASNGPDRDCRSDCVLNRCGDGFANLNGTRNKEECDGAPEAAPNDRRAVPVEQDDCNIDCTIPECGDGKVNRLFIPQGSLVPEQCDNAGANANNADCTEVCQVAVCGDNLENTVGPRLEEGCDDGNRNDNDDCNNACIDRRCGDGIVDPTEECDLGDSVNSDTGACLRNCKISVCGDGKVRAGVEQCDGAPVGTTQCSAACRLQVCGNGIIDPQEECDDGSANNNNADCRADCIINRCGDGFRNSAGTQTEQCDGAAQAGPRSTAINPINTATCNANCTNASCGDGFFNPLVKPIMGNDTVVERCDDDNNTNGDSCSETCQFERCGNNIVDPGEQCDGAPVNGKQCSATCRLQECGNSIVDPTEECDDGPGNGNNADCRADCVINRCGDGHINTSAGPNQEACDGGPIAGTNSRVATPTNAANCNSNCTAPSCGDNIVNPLFRPVVGNTATEQCDDDGNAPGDGCSATCQLERCGNGVTDPHEQCDDGDADNTDDCTTLCQFARCGDGFERSSPAVPANLEECDDGDADNTDDCTTLCKDATCRDGFIRSNPAVPADAEECDSGPGALITDCPYSPTQTACQVCNASCDLVPGNTSFCGDGIVQAGREVCDGGSRGCGACSSTCNTVFSRAATGLLLAVGGSAYATGDRFAIGDGVDTITFELTETTAGSGRTPIVIADADTAFQVAGKIADAIENSTLRITPAVLGNAVILTHQRATTTGNVAITPTVTTADNLVVDGMEGAQGGQCVTGQPCKVGAECASNQCNTNTGLCVAP